jgi:hypothetical protein
MSDTIDAVTSELAPYQYHLQWMGTLPWTTQSGRSGPVSTITWQS